MVRIIPRFAFLVSLTVAAQSQAAELWMFTSAACGACQQFEREVGDRYHLTAEARRVPLHRIALDAPRPPPIADIADVRGTPTFVLMDGRTEIGRIAGYSSDELFWMRITALLAELPSGPHDVEGQSMPPGHTRPQRPPH